MGWVIMDLTPAPDGSRVDFAVSQVPIPESVMVIYNGIRQVRVAVNPTEGEAEYGIAGTAVKMGIAPAASSDFWCRFFALPQ